MFKKQPVASGIINQPQMGLPENKVVPINPVDEHHFPY